MEDKKSDNDENSIDNDLSDDQECVLHIKKSVSQLEETSGKKFGISIEDYLTADDDLMVFAGVTDEDILSEITDEIGNNDEDDDDIDNTGPSQSLLSSQEALQSVNSLRTFFSSLPSTNEEHFRALDSMHTVLVHHSVLRHSMKNFIAIYRDVYSGLEKGF
ncbi:hypothetical protein X975_09249, partial [Stegodyphus mimosarum]